MTPRPDALKRIAAEFRIHPVAELDLMIVSGGKRFGIEYKYTDAPSRSRSMSVAMEDLGLEHLWVVFPEGPEYPLDKRITAMPMKSVPRLVQRLKRKRR
jgi:hypothetical protein